MSMQTGSHGAFRDGRPLAPARTGPWSTAEIVLRDNAGFLAAELAFVAGIVALSIAVLAHPGPLPGDVGLTLWWQHLALPAHWLATPLEALSTITFPQPFSLILAGLIVVFLLLRRRLDLLVALATVALGLGSSTSTFIGRDPPVRACSSRRTSRSSTMCTASPPAMS